MLVLATLATVAACNAVLPTPLDRDDASVPTASTDAVTSKDDTTGSDAADDATGENDSSAAQDSADTVDGGTDASVQCFGADSGLHIRYHDPVPVPPCCAGLHELILREAETFYGDGGPTRLCMDWPHVTFACTVGTCGDGVCEPGENEGCGCVADCPDAAWGPDWP